MSLSANFHTLFSAFLFGVTMTAIKNVRVNITPIISESVTFCFYYIMK